MTCVEGWVGRARVQEPYTEEEKRVLMDWVRLQKFRQEAMQAIAAANVSAPPVTP